METEEFHETTSQEDKLLEIDPKDGIAKSVTIEEVMDMETQYESNNTTNKNERTTDRNDESTEGSFTTKKRKRKSGALRRKNKRLHMEMKKSKADHESPILVDPAKPEKNDTSTASAKNEPRDTLTGDIKGLAVSNRREIWFFGTRDDESLDSDC